MTRWLLMVCMGLLAGCSSFSFPIPRFSLPDTDGPEAVWVAPAIVLLVRRECPAADCLLVLAGDDDTPLDKAVADGLRRAGMAVLRQPDKGEVPAGAEKLRFGLSTDDNGAYLRVVLGHVVLAQFFPRRKNKGFGAGHAVTRWEKA